jgi:hypothetical protein
MVRGVSFVNEWHETFSEFRIDKFLKNGNFELKKSNAVDEQTPKNTRIINTLIKIFQLDQKLPSE